MEFPFCFFLPEHHPSCENCWIAPATFLKCFQNIFIWKNATVVFFLTCKKSVCAHAAAAAAADPLAADTVFWKVNRSQYVPVVSAKPAPISRNRWVFVQQDRGDSGKYGGASAPRASFFFLLSLLSYLLKEALTGARTILGNVFPVFHLSLPSFLLIPSSFQLLQFTQQRSRFTLPPLPPKDPPLSLRPIAHTL